MIELRQLVTRLKDAQPSTSLRHSQEQIGLFIEYTPAAIAIFDRQFLDQRVRRENGEWCWLYSRETPFIRNADGKVRQILGVSTDITERKQAEFQLQQQAQNLEHTLLELQLTQSQVISKLFANLK